MVTTTSEGVRQGRGRPDRDFWKDHTGPDQKDRTYERSNGGDSEEAASAFQVWEHLSEEGELALQREGLTGKMYGRED